MRILLNVSLNFVLVWTTEDGKRAQKEARSIDIRRNKTTDSKFWNQANSTKRGETSAFQCIEKGEYYIEDKNWNIELTSAPSKQAE